MLLDDGDERKLGITPKGCSTLTDPYIHICNQVPCNIHTMLMLCYFTIFTTIPFQLLKS